MCGVCMCEKDRTRRFCIIRYFIKGFVHMYVFLCECQCVTDFCLEITQLDTFPNTFNIYTKIGKPGHTCLYK